MANKSLFEPYILKNMLGGRLRRTYYMAYPENENQIQMSLNMYRLGEGASITMTQLAGGTFLASLLLMLNFREEGIALVFGLSNVASIIQLFTALWVQRMFKRKPFVSASILLKLGFGFMFFLPLWFGGSRQVQVLAAILFLLGYIGMQVGNSPAKEWVLSMVRPGERGYYFAKTDAFSVGFLTLATISMGFTMDYFKTRNENIGYMIIGMTLIALVAINFVSFSRMKEKRTTKLDSMGRELHGRLLRRSLPVENSDYKVSIFSEIKYGLGNKAFRRELILGLLFTTGFQMGLPFNASYQIKELGLSFSFIMIIGAIANVLRMMVSSKMGRWGDQVGTGKVLKYAFLGLVLHHVFMAFAHKENAHIMIPMAIFSGALAWSYVGTGLLNTQFELLDESRMTVQLSIVSLFTSVWGYLTIAFSTGMFALFENIIGRRNWNYYPQQAINIINVGVYLVTIIYIHYKIQPLAEESK